MWPFEGGNPPILFRLWLALRGCLTLKFADRGIARPPPVADATYARSVPVLSLGMEFVAHIINYDMPEDCGSLLSGISSLCRCL